MSTQVTAHNMGIKASTSGSLLISKVNNSWTTATTSIDFNLKTTDALVAVIPASINPSSSAAWYTALGTDATHGAKPADQSYTALTGIADGTGSESNWYKVGSNAYALHEQFYIQSPSGTLEKLGLQSVSFTKLNSAGVNDDIEKAVTIRVVITPMEGDTLQTGEAKIVTWSNAGKTTMTYVNGTAHGSTAIGQVLKGTGTLVRNASDNESSHIIQTVQSGKSYHVDVYMYLDGENPNCTSYLAAGWLGSYVSLTFGANTTYAQETTVALTQNLTNVTSNNSAATATINQEFSATYTEVTGYALPADIVVKVGGDTLANTSYNWNSTTGALTIPAAQVVGDIEITVVGVAP